MKVACLYVLQIPENEGVILVAAQDALVTIDQVGPYFRISADDDIVIDRGATGCRHAVWYSAIAGLEDSIIVQYDKDALRVVAR
ncbi:MAG: hypothetical protein QOI79_4668 [Mycobacterium sp.]|nr:hypothetical protein [Mycobacterium sp.]MDT5145301.1 hypothetical protein [Mycobacterium sp.]MDT5199805.1 hypothetical protein [Mycobacterium sp.]MDT5290810.1 hypothetical protein [Mycobacterium sp.]